VDASELSPRKGHGRIPRKRDPAGRGEDRLAVSALLALSEVIEARDPYARGHSARVARMAHVLGVKLGCDAAGLAALGLGGALHDVGKLTVAEAILNKPGPLTEAEVEEVRRHPEAGARLVVLDESLLPAVPGILYHHERWDGAGYPARRCRDEIPFEARILAVVDSFDAMTSNRPYRSAMPVERAVEELDRCAGSQFDPDVAIAFVEAWEAGAFRVAAVLRAVVRESTRPRASNAPCESPRR
jgi:HD-GYP domain-containing protein (c-di-GMP phosphodiesterase class II)